MRFEFDEAKNQKNIRERGLPFTLATEFDWSTAIVLPSNRGGESRFFAMGYLAGRLHALVFTKRGDRIRVISLRRANRREAKRYEENQQSRS